MSERHPQPVDLAPANPYSLVLRSPLLMAPGCGVRDIEPALLGATVTRTATIHTRHGPTPQFASVPAGLLVTDMPTISIRTLLKEDARRWQRATLPVIVSIQGSGDELAEMAATLEGVEGVAAVLIAAEDDGARATAAVRAETPRPLLVVTPVPQGKSSTTQAIVAAGADALVVVGDVQGAAPGDPPLIGTLFGPIMFPGMFATLLELKAAVDVPLVACGGIVSPQMAQAALDAGATAFMLDAPRWGDLAAAQRIADGLALVT